MVHLVLISNGNHDDDIAIVKWEPLLTTDIQENAANVYLRAVASKKYSRVLWIGRESDAIYSVLGLLDVHGHGIHLSSSRLWGIMAGCRQTVEGLVMVHNGCKGG